MDAKNAQIDQEPDTSSEQAQPVAPAPVAISNLSDITDVENEKPPVPPLKFNTISDEEARARSKNEWLVTIFTVIALIQLACIGLFIFMTSTGSGAGSEFGAFLGLFLYLIPGGIVAIINLISLPIYLVKRNPVGVPMYMGIGSLVLSIAFVLYVLYRLI